MYGYVMKNIYENTYMNTVKLKYIYIYIYIYKMMYGYVMIFFFKHTWTHNKIEIICMYGFFDLKKNIHEHSKIDTYIHIYIERERDMDM